MPQDSITSQQTPREQVKQSSSNTKGFQSESLFEPAQDLNSSPNNSDDEIPQPNRYSLLESKDTNSLQNTSKKHINGRLSERPATSMGTSSNEPKSSFKGKRTTLENSSQKQVKIQESNSKSKLKLEVSKLYNPSERPISPHQAAKKSQVIPSKQVSSQLIRTNNMVMELSVTTTTTVLIKERPNGQIEVEHKPEIHVEALDEDTEELTK